MLLILLMEHCENGMGLGIEVDCQTSMVYTASLFVFSSYQLLVGMLFHVGQFSQCKSRAARLVSHKPMLRKL